MSTESAQIEKKKKLSPKLRFKAFQESWNRILIQKLIDDGIIISHLDGNHGGLYPRSEEFASSGVPYITANDFINGEVSFDSCKFLPFERAKQFKKGIAKSGDVLFAHNATVGPTALLETEFEYVILSTTATYFRCDNKNLLNLFLKYSFETKEFVEQYSRVMSQSTRNQVPITTQRKFTLALPEFPEQQKIASFLSAVDEKIQQLTRKKELLEQYKKGVMQQLFSGKLRFKDENGKQFPKWEEKKLGDIGNTFNGLTGKTKENFGEGKPYIQYMQIFANSRIDVSKCGLVQIYKDENQQQVKYGDVFFTTSSETPDEIGTCSVLLDETGEMYLNSFCFGYRPNSLEQLVPQFAQYLFRNEIFRKLIIKLAQGSTRYNMSKVELMKLKISLPSRQEQQKIASFLTALNAKIESVAAQITHTQTFKKGLLQQMFV